MCGVTPRLTKVFTSFWTSLLLLQDGKKCTKLRHHLCFENKAGDKSGMFIKGRFCVMIVRIIIIKTLIDIAFPFFRFNIKVTGPRFPHS